MKKVLLTLAICLFIVSNADAILIGPGAFGPTATRESFEGLSAGTNIEVWSSDSAFLVPGVSGPYTVSSGVTLTAPIPNPTGSGGVLIGDFALGSATWGLGAYGTVSSADVPSGTAYMGLNSTSSGSFIEFTFPSDMLMVGAFVDSYGANTTLEAFDSLGNLIET